MTIKVWDPVVRITHWTMAGLFIANMTLLDEDGTAHAYAGYVLFGIVLTRLVWGMIGTKNARFRTFWPTRADIRLHVAEYFGGPRHAHLSHNPLGALMVVNLLASLVLISITGILISTFGIDQVGGLHEFLANYTTACVGLHILGVFVERRRTGIDLIKAMVTGRKPIP